MNINYIKDFQKPLKLFLITKFFAYSQSAFASFLINIYFWRITHNISFLILFNVIFYLSHSLAYILAGKISKEINRFLPLRTGMILQVAYLALILISKDKVIDFIVPIAIIGGIAHGAYWSSDDLLKLDLTNPENRFKFSTFYEVLRNTAGLLIPLIASILVVSDGGIFHSYSRVFVAAIIFAILVLTSSFFISSKKTFKSEKYSLWTTSKKLLKNENIKIALISRMFWYVADVMPVLLGLLLFLSSGTELSLGGYQFITVLIMIITNYLAGSFLKRKSYKALLIYGGIINFLLIFILVLNQGYVAIFIYGILSSLVSFTASPLYPLTNDAFNMCCKNKKECIDMRVEFNSTQELFIGSGRILGYLLLIIIYYHMSILTIGVTVIILGFFQLLARFYITKIKDGKYVTIDGMN